MNLIRQWIARCRLAKMVASRRDSFEIRRFRERRAAAKLGWQRRKMAEG